MSQLAKTLFPAAAGSDHSVEHATLPRVLAFSGGLGSGKTSTINALLEQCGTQLGGVLVIENDLGKFNVDATRLRVAPDQIRALTAGCVCCTDLNSLRTELQQQLASKDPPRTIIIETTGIAEPARIKELLAEFSAPSALVVTISVADFASNQARGLLAGHAESADLILITWWDHLAVAQRPLLDQVLTHCGEVAPGTPVSLLDRNSEVVQLPPEICMSSSLPAIRSEPHGVPSRQPTTSAHQHPFKSYSLALPPQASFKQITDFVSNCAEQGIALARCKGQIHGRDFDLVQGRLRQAPESDSEPGNSNRQSEMQGWVNVIAYDPIPPHLLETLRGLRVSPAFLPKLSEQQLVEHRITAIERALSGAPASFRDPLGRPQVDFEYEEVWSTDVERPGIPAALVDRFYAQVLALRVPLAEEIRAGMHDADERLPYLKKRVGGTTAWLLSARSDAVSRLSYRDRVESIKPASLWLEGMLSIRNPHHTGTFKEVELPGMIKRARQAAVERSCDPADAERELQLAFQRHAELSPLSWSNAPAALRRALQS